MPLMQYIQFFKMLKIITDFAQLEAINNAAQIIENNPLSKYDEGIKHCMLEKWAILFSPWLEKPEVKELCPFITDEWLQTDIIETLTQDWFWHYDTSIRIIIPNYLILKEAYLKALINYCDDNNVPNYVDIDNSFIYVNEIYPEHQTLFDMYEQIKIETK